MHHLLGYLPPYTNLHMCSRLISTTFRIFNERTNNDSMQCQLKLKIGARTHIHMHPQIHTCIIHRTHQMKLVEKMVREIQTFSGHIFFQKKKNLDSISVSSSVMWSYNRNRFNELQIKKTESIVAYGVMKRKNYWYIWEKRERERIRSKVKGNKRNNRFHHHRKWFYEQRKTVKLYWHMCALRWNVDAHLSSIHRPRRKNHSN